MEGEKIKLEAFINTALKKLFERDLLRGLIKQDLCNAKWTVEYDIDCITGIKYPNAM